MRRGSHIFLREQGAFSVPRVRNDRKNTFREAAKMLSPEERKKLKAHRFKGNSIMWSETPPPGKNKGVYSISVEEMVSALDFISWFSVGDLEWSLWALDWVSDPALKAHLFNRCKALWYEEEEDEENDS